MWQIQKFETADEMLAWLEENNGLIQYSQVFVDNGYAVEWRPLKWILFDEDCDEDA